MLSDDVRTLVIDGRSRSALVHVPNSCRAESPVALMFAFHGGGSSAAEMVGFSGLNDKSNEAGFIVVYPNGTGRNEKYLTWNGGNCCGYAARQNVDDVKFVRALLENLLAEFNIDRGQIFATGMSNGAVMAYRLANEMADVFAAIAPVAGVIGAEGCNPSRPVSVIHFHGTDDQFVPIAGGIGRRSLSRTRFLPVQQGLDCWIKANRCPAAPRIEHLPTPLERFTLVRDPGCPTEARFLSSQAENFEHGISKTGIDPDMKITRRTWGPGREGAEVVYIVAEGAGHTWPGRVPTITMLGRSTLSISANDLMWDFFQKHARSTQPSCQPPGDRPVREEGEA